MAKRLGLGQVTGLQKCLAVFSAVIMLIVVFHTMVGIAQAASTEDKEDQVEVLEHDHLRLTTSNIGAVLPSEATSCGVIYIAWADLNDFGSRLAYKSSSDGGKTFTADKAISETFLSILDLRIAASADGSKVAVAAEIYRTDDSCMEMVLVLSEDGGASWSQSLVLGKGHAPTVSFLENKAIIGFTSAGDEPAFTAASIARDDSGLNGTWLFRVPMGDGIGAIACGDSSIHFTFRPESKPGIIAYGRVGSDGKVLTNIELVRSGEEQVSNSFLMVRDSMPYVIFSVHKGSSSALILCTPGSKEAPWSELELAELEGSLTDFSASFSGKGIGIMFQSVGEESSIGILESTIDGDLVEGPRTLSTAGADCARPNTVAVDGLYSCVWQEEHGKGSELIYAADALLIRPNLESLTVALSTLSEGAMLCDALELKVSICSDLQTLDGLISSSQEAAAISQIDRLLKDIDSGSAMPKPLDPKQATRLESDVGKVVSTLKELRESLLHPVVHELPSTDLSSAYIYDLKVEVSSPTLSSISWFTSELTERDELSMTAVHEEPLVSSQANQGRYHIIEVATDYNTTYNFTCRSWLGGENLEAEGAFTSGLAIENLTVSGNGSSCSVEWTTSFCCDAMLSYASEGSSLTLSPVNTIEGGRHSSALMNLTPGIRYEICVMCASDLFPMASSSASAAFIAPSRSEEAQEVAVEVESKIGHGSVPSQFGASPPYVSITNVASSVTGPHTVRVTWTTNVVATSVVEYGLTTGYGVTATGTNVTSHTVDLTGLDAFALYHLRVRSTEVADPTDTAVSSDYQIRVVYNDDNRGSDAGNAFATAMRTAAGLHGGWLDSGSDSADYYSINLAAGQLLAARLIVPSGYDYNLYIYNPSNVLKASSTNSGSTAETASYTADVAGLWEVAVTRVTAPGQGIYLLWTNVTGGFDVYDLDVGGSGDNDAVGRLPGMAILDGTGWSSASGGKRDAVANSAFVLNLNPSSYQAYTDYLITIRYTSSAGTSVQVLSGGSWATVSTLPSSTSWTSRSFLLSSSLLSDGIPDTQAGMNVKLRFSAAASIDSMNALAYGYCSGVTYSSPEHVPGTVLETGWTVNSLGVANASSGATLIVSLPRADLTYVVQFTYLNATQGQEVQQLTASSTWKSLGKLSRWGKGACVLLDATYYDIDAVSPGCNVRIKLLSPLYNLSGVRVTPCLTSTDVGVTGDDSASSHVFGASVYPNSEWSSITSVDGRTVRYTTCATANFLVNGAWSAKAYEVTMTYKTSSAGYVRQYSGSSYYNLASLTADGQWHDVTFKTRSDIIYDYEAAGSINMLFEITSTTCYVDKLSVSVDSDNDGYSDAKEQQRFSSFDSTNYVGNMQKSFSIQAVCLVTISFKVTLTGSMEYINGHWVEDPAWGYAYVDGNCIWSGHSTGLNPCVFTPSVTVTLAYGAHVFSMSFYLSGSTTNISMANSFDMDPFSNDTDGDGMLDGVELSGGTSPCRADCDSDGLADGSELYSQVWSTDNFYTIPDNGQTTNRVVIKFTLPALSAPLTAVWLQVGILHTDASQLMVKVQRGTGTVKTLHNRAAGVNLFKSWNLFSQGYVLADFTSSATWTIYVEDYVSSSGATGRVEYAKMQADGKTDPLDDDSDNDGIKDGEEVQFGVDGWCTNPRSTDSDGDGLTDQNEINGVTPCSSATDPTRNDTDDDGYLDNADLYMGDMVVRLTIQEYRSKEDINGGNTRNIFFVVYSPTGTFATKRKTGAVTGTTYTLNWVYDVDVADTATTATFDMDAVADDAGTLGDDIKLDGAPGDPRNLHAVYTLSTSYITVTSEGDMGGLDFDADCYMKIKLERTVKSRSNLIVINGSDDSGGYGLYKVSTNNYRFNADQQVYVIDLNVASAGGHFTAGMNTILLPRSIALQCKLNFTLENLGSISSSHPLYGASFVYTNTSQAVSSAHVVVVISKNVTYSQGETLLYDLTHDSSNARIGNNVAIQASNIYLLHLPRDVLEAVPMNVQNDGLGPGPNYLDPLNVIVSVLFFPIICAFFVIGTVLVLTFLLIDLGLKVLGSMLAAAATVIKQAVDKLIEALNAFVNWAIQFICDAFTALVAAPLQALSNALMSWATGLVALISNAALSIEKGTPNAKASLPIVQYILNSDLFYIFLAIGIGLFTILMAASLLGPFCFLAPLVVPFLVNLLISGMIAALFVIPCVIDFIGWIFDSICDVLGDDLTQGMAGVMGATMGTIVWLSSVVTSPVVKDFVGFITSSLGAILAWAGNLMDSAQELIADIIGAGLSAWGSIDLFITGTSPLLDLNPTALSIMKGITLMEAGICVFELTTAVAGL